MDNLPRQKYLNNVYRYSALVEGEQDLPLPLSRHGLCTVASFQGKQNGKEGGGLSLENLTNPVFACDQGQHPQPKPVLTACARDRM